MDFSCHSMTRARLRGMDNDLYTLRTMLTELATPLLSIIHHNKLSQLPNNYMVQL